MARKPKSFAGFKLNESKLESTAFCTEDWAGGSETPMMSFDLIGKMQKGSVMVIDAAPWVRDAYAAENISREKKKLKPLTWTRFCDLLVDEKARKKMLVANQFMKAALASLRSVRP